METELMEVVAEVAPVPEVRWKSVPTDGLPWRDGLFAWGPGEAVIVRDYVQRQGPEVWEWVCARAADRHLELSLDGGDSGASRTRLIYESCLDLAVWQQQTDARRAIERLRGVEQSYRSVKKEKGGK